LTSSVYEIIIKKKRGFELAREEIEYIVNGYVSGEIPDYQMSALLMAICFNSLSAEETACLTLAMAHSGDMLDLSPLGFCVDKHSTGGVGDKITLIAAPIAAACGARVPKMSGRGLGHTGGTIDKLESIPEFSTELSYDDFIRIVNETGFAIAGQTANLVPADKKIYALRDCTGTVDSIPLICSSIMSKKLASGANGIVLDVKFGSGAFMKTPEEAEKLAKAMVEVGKLAGRRVSAILTDMNAPHGRAIGNSLEVIEAIQTLKGSGPADLEELSIAVAAEMLCVAGRGSEKKCFKLAEKALKSGMALDTFRRMIELQGGNPRVIDDTSLLPCAAYEEEVLSDKGGVIDEMDCEKLGLLSLELGAGRKTKDDPIDHAAGILMLKTLGDSVAVGEPVAVLYSSRPGIDMRAAADKLRAALTIISNGKNKNVNNILKIIKGIDI